MGLECTVHFLLRGSNLRSFCFLWRGRRECLGGVFETLIETEESKHYMLCIYMHMYTYINICKPAGEVKEVRSTRCACVCV